MTNTGLDRFGRVVDQRWCTPDGYTVERYGYGYDRDSNMLYQENRIYSVPSQLLTYDALNRVATSQWGTLSSDKSSIVGTPFMDRSWTLDSAGNWDSITSNGSTVTQTQNAQNQISTLSYDGNGNATTDDTGKQYVYDAWNRMVTAKSSGGATLESYSYDALGRRITLTAGSATTTSYYSSAWQVLEERVGGVVKMQYVWTPLYVDGLIERDRDADGNAGNGLEERLYALQNANWNVTALMNTAGEAVEKYVYDPYGQFYVYSGTWDARSTSAYGWTILHQGGAYNWTTGLYLFRHRDYSPTLGRWMQQDPMGYVDGVSLYGYEAGNPTDGEDPMGLADKSSPWDVGWEWLTGTGPRKRRFGNGDPFTELLQKHQHIQSVRDKVAEKLANNCKQCNSGRIAASDPYDLSGWSGIPKYLNDYSTLLTAGMTGNLAVTYLGSYELRYTASSVDCKSGRATLHIHVYNASTIQSATHPPVIGYTPWWNTHIGAPLDIAFYSGPMSKTEQVFDWDESISFTPNKCCK